ncbi:MAG: nuclear transport factor 2 family protein [Acidobacteria bacterium]|nr:nuclear transport factor 2 family protein [Acidobacteriota bacterium]
MSRFLPALLLLTLLTVPAAADSKVSPEDEAGIRAAALDYVEGYYEGNPDRMERALHPHLAKRIARTDANGRTRLDQMSAMELVQIIRLGTGKNIPKDKQVKSVTILDVFGNSASVRAEMLEWVDYMHLAKVNGQWKIINVLWEMKPKPQ